MRFETSQTTPPHMDRRLQLRMLSFVGLIAVIMFTLSAMNLRPRDANSQQAGASPDSLTFEVRREERDLKAGEFIIPVAEADGPRGQSPRSPAAGNNRDLFTSRNKERSRNGAEDEKLFRRRNAATKKAAGIDLDNGRKSIDPQSFEDQDLTVGARPAKDRLPPTGSPLVDEDWSSEPVAVNGIDSERRFPSVVQPRRRHDIPAEPIEETHEPFRSERIGDDDLTSIRDLEATEIDGGRDIPQTGRRQPKRRDGLIQDSDASAGSHRYDEDLEPPIDLRRHRSPSRLPESDTPPPYGEIAPVRIDARYLDVVKDNTVGIRRDESEVFYWLLDHARRVPSAALERAGEREVQYINLMTEPERFRGEPVTIEGDLWRLYEFDAGKNGYGVTKIYEGWVFTGDSSNHPYRIVCTSLPNGIEPGENLRKPVRVTGYFFKREGYRSKGGVHVAPTLLARRININPMPNGIPLTAGILPYMIITIMAVGLALLVTIVGFAIGDARSSRAGMERLRRQPQISLIGMEIPATLSVEESLRQFAERENASAVNGAYGPLFSRQAAREHAVHNYATSHQIMSDASNRVHRQQTGTLKNWSARQQAAQAEIDALRAPQPGDPGIDCDELSSDALDPAKNRLVTPKTAEPFVAKSAINTKVKTSIRPSPDIAPPAAKKSTPQIPPVATVPTPTPARPTNISYSASKLSEWEEEVAMMTQPVAETSVPDSPEARPSEQSATPTIVQDQQSRDSELRNQFRIEREHIERERLIRDEVIHVHVDDDRVSFDRADRDSKSFSLASPTPPIDASTEIDDDAASDDLASESESPSHWARFRKRRNR